MLNQAYPSIFSKILNLSQKFELMSNNAAIVDLIIQFLYVLKIGCLHQLVYEFLSIMMLLRKTNVSLVYNLQHSPKPI